MRMARLQTKATALSSRAVEHLEAWRQIDVFLQLQAGTAGGIVDEKAFNDRCVGRDQDLRGLGNAAVGPRSREQSLLIHGRRLFPSSMDTAELIQPFPLSMRTRFVEV
jgi:hypothetical protein